MADDLVRQRYEEDTRDYQDAVATVKEYQCGICGGLLVVFRIADHWISKCGGNRDHEGFRVLPTATEVYRAGGQVPVYLANAIDRSRPAVANLQLMAQIWQSKQGKLTKAGAYQAALYSLQVGLDPRFGEIACLEFGRGQVKTPTVMITEKGWRTLASRECADIFDRTPVLVDVVEAAEKEKLGAAEEDFVCKALGTLRGDDPRLPLREAIGVYTVRQWERDKQRPGPEGQGTGPAAEMPQNQARARASRHWYEQHVPQAIERARSAWAETVNQLDVQGAENVIEAEFTWANEEPPRQIAGGQQERRRSPSYPQLVEPPPAAMTWEEFHEGCAAAGIDERFIRATIGLPEQVALTRWQITTWAQGVLYDNATLGDALAHLIDLKNPPSSLDEIVARREDRRDRVPADRPGNSAQPIFVDEGTKLPETQETLEKLGFPEFRSESRAAGWTPRQMREWIGLSPEGTFEAVLAGWVQANHSYEEAAQLCVEGAQKETS